MALQVSWKMRFLLILLGGVFLFVTSILLPQSASAATTTYNYTKDGKIAVKFEDQTYYLTKSPISMGGKDTYNGVVTLSGNSGLGLGIPNLSAPLQGKCALGISITASPGASSGQVSAPAALNGIPGAGNGGQSYTPSCSKELASKQTEFNRSISIGTTDTNSGSNPETEGDREVIVTLYSPVPNPPNVTITQKKPNSDTRTISNWTTSTKSEVWGNVDGGTQFEFCISPAAPFDSQSCKTGTKKTGEPLLISFGSAENAFNADGKKVLVDVNLNIPAAPTSTTYGPLGVTIFSNDKSVQGSTQTESNTFGKDGQPTVAQKFTLKALFDGIDAGTYKVCLTNNTNLCSAEFTKESNKQAKASIDVSEEETKKLAVGEAGPTCAIDGVGWIICPTVNFLAWLADGAFKIISDSFLSTNIGVVDVNGPSYKAWTIMRNLANAAFVIAFLIIIFSQLTSLGVSNYGVKKMLPRLIIAAILVNLSFFICQAAVDLSNVLGYGIQNSISGIGDNIANISSSSDGVSPFADGSSFVFIAGGILAFAAGGVLIYALLSTFIPVILAAVIALVMILLLLVARQALILILVVISPLAFVAYLLPNTEKLFTQWRKILTALLLLFPIIALVFGLSSLASKVLTYTFSGDLGADSSANSWFGQIIGAAVLVLPLFVVPSLLKKSLDSVPMIGQMASKLASRTSGRVGSKLKESYNGSLVGRGIATRQKSKENYRTRRFAERISKSGRLGAVNQFLATGVPILPADRYAAKSLKRDASDAAEEYIIKDTQRASKSMEGKVDPQGLRKLAKGGVHVAQDGSKFNGSDIATRAAAIEQIVASNDIKGMADLWNESKTWEGEEGRLLRASFARSLQSSSNRPTYYGAGALAALKLNNHSSHENTLTDAVAAGAYSPEKIASADKDELNEVARVSKAKSAADPSYTPSHTKLQTDANIALTDRNLAPRMSKNRDNAAYLANLPGSSAPTPLT